MASERGRTPFAIFKLFHEAVTRPPAVGISAYMEGKYNRPLGALRQVGPLETETIMKTALITLALAVALSLAVLSSVNAKAPPPPPDAADVPTIIVGE